MHICTQQESSKICEAKTDSIEGKHRQLKIIIGDFETSLSIMSRITRQKTRRNQKTRTIV